MRIKFKVQQGTVHVNSIRVLQATKEVICISVDFKEKYLEHVVKARENGVQFNYDILYGGTLGSDKSALDKLTRIQILNLPKIWYRVKTSTFVSTGRYSSRICLVKEASEKAQMKLGYWDYRM